MIYQKCKHCGMDWHGFKRTHCPYCGKKIEGSAEDEKDV